MSGHVRQIGGGVESLRHARIQFGVMGIVLTVQFQNVTDCKTGRLMALIADRACHFNAIQQSGKNYLYVSENVSCQAVVYSVAHFVKLGHQKFDSVCLNMSVNLFLTNHTATT